jgi:hypothetical protein
MTGGPWVRQGDSFESNGMVLRTPPAVRFPLPGNGSTASQCSPRLTGGPPAIRRRHPLGWATDPPSWVGHDHLNSVSPVGARTRPQAVWREVVS